ncbi:MAG: hypothetical protein LBM93_04840 [Oscillospiraceae bacterium]|jgi:hypothetical protein|nr:hypothetical protein [Oscillospiraceae bacterium]
MYDLERQLRNTMGDTNFEAVYRSAFARLKADRYGDYPLHEVVLKTFRDMVIMQNGGEPIFMPFGAPGVPQPEADSLRILQGSNGTNSSGSNNASNSPNSGRCYIATAVYGSYDCPEVWTLRRFRDYILAPKW